MRGQARLKSLVKAVKRRVYGKRGEPYRIAGHTLRFTVGRLPEPQRWKTKPYPWCMHPLQYELFTKILREGDRAIDVGSSDGAEAIIMAALCGASGEVIAFEPHEDSVAAFRAAIALNPGIKAPCIERYAVYDRAGEASFYGVGGVDDNASLSPREGVFDAPPVRTIALDEYLAAHPGRPPRLVKIDAEGAEIKILQGARRLLESDAFILCELHPFAWQNFGTSRETLAEVLAAAGRLGRYIHDNTVLPAEPYYGIVALERFAPPSR